MEIRYFCIKDFTYEGLIQFKHFPTEKMLTDFFTKPLQGSLFKKFREVILGHVPVSSTYQYNVSSSKERVGTHKPDQKEKPISTTSGCQ